VSCSFDRTVRVWNVETGQEVRQLKGHAGEVWALALSPEGQRVLSGSRDGQVRLWDLQSGALLAIAGTHDAAVTDLSFTPDGARALTSGHDNMLRLWSRPAATLGGSAGLVGHWKLDEGMGTEALDSSGQSHHGTLEDNPIWTEGKVGGGLELDNGAHVKTTFTGQLDVWTIAVWVKGHSAPGNGRPSGPLHREKNFQISWDHGPAVDRGAAFLCVNRIWYRASFGPLAGGRWYHLAATFDGEKLRAYTDGALTSTTDVPGVADAEEAPLVLGKHAVSRGFFAGVIDEARVYDRPLSARDIADLFSAR
jgi:WD40 repeat protein